MKIKLLFLLTMLSAEIFAQNAPQLPLQYLSTCMPVTTSTITVCASGCDYNNSQLQLAIDNANAGAEIILEAGASYIGHFNLPDKAGNAWTVIRSSMLSSLPPQGTRVAPAQASLMPKLLSPDNLGVISCGTRAHHYRFTGIEFSVSAAALGDANNGGTSNSGLVRLGDFYETTLADQGHNFVMDRCYIHGHPQKNTRRGMHINSGYTSVIDCYLSDFHDLGADAQAIGIMNGPGPFKIVNNYLEASGENFMVGGADPSIPNLVPSDMEIRGNHFFKPLSWWVSHPSYGGYHWMVKNLFELKQGRRLLIDGNIFENNWVDAQTGTAINLKTANQDGTNTWAITEDITFSNNIVRHSGSAVTISGKDAGVSLLTSRVKIFNNIFDDIHSVTYGGASGHFAMILSAPIDITFDHNTCTQDQNIITVDVGASPGFVFTNNITRQNLYGIKGSGTGSGNATIAAFFPAAVFSKNVMVGNAANYPANNFYPPHIDTVKFVNFNNGNGGDYHLKPVSAYNNAATDGKDVGADVDSVLLKTATVISGITPDCQVTDVVDVESANNQLTVIPNPAKNDFIINLGVGSASRVSVAVYSLWGQKVMEWDNNKFLSTGRYSYHAHIDVPGLYFVMATIGSRVLSYKFVVKP